MIYLKHYHLAYTNNIVYVTFISIFTQAFETPVTNKQSYTLFIRCFNKSKRNKHK